MKRLIAVISGLLVLPAFAEVAPAYYYEDVIEYSDELVAPAEEATETTEQQEEQKNVVTPVVPTTISPRNTTGRAAASRAVASSTASRNISTRNTTTTPARSVTTRAATTTASQTTSSNRAATTTTTNRRPSTTARSTTTTQTQGVTSRQASQSNNTNTARASIVQTDTATTPLYISSRVGVSSGTTNVQARVPTVRVGTTTTTTTSSESVSGGTSLDELAQITDFCKAQYTACMDNFCNVLDDNQGRCSCSANLKNYAETEEALKQATEELQDVAQKIQYIGLTADEIETLFTQTEAELEMQTTSDNTQLKNDLDKIKKMIIDVETGTATSTTSGLSLDLSGLLDFTIDSTGFDLSNLLGTTTDTSSISNQRGEQLYKTAAARCKAAVLNSCSAQGVDISVITNSYDLEIDKQCILYERSLTESNDQMKSTVRNAKNVLQKARLLVAQEKNSYDLRGCVNALDSCMQDDFVCGSDYENCLDPTGKYIVNGEIITGSAPGVPGDIEGDLYATWSYGSDQNAWGTDEASGTLAGYINETVTASLPSSSNTSNMSEFLQNKIGYHDDSDGKNYGMCMSVLNKCQDITYSGTGQSLKYKPNNDVIKEFLNRTLIQIKYAQDEILSDYAENCITDVSSCLSQNNYNTNNPTSINIAVNACKSIITTCMSVNGADVQDQVVWVNSIFSNLNCPSDSEGTYPNCICDNNKAGYEAILNKCMVCPGLSENGLDSDFQGKYPNCSCEPGYEYDKTTNKCNPEA